MDYIEFIGEGNIKVFTSLFLVLVVSIPFFIARFKDRHSWDKIRNYELDKQNIESSAILEANGRRLLIANSIRINETTKLSHNVVILLILYTVVEAAFSVLSGGDLSEAIIYVLIISAGMAWLVYFLETKVGVKEDMKKLTDLTEALGQSTPLTVTKLASIQYTDINQLNSNHFN